MVLRVLQAFSIGGALGVLLLGILTDTTIPIPWFLGFLVATIVLFVIRWTTARRRSEKETSTTDAHQKNRTKRTIFTATFLVGLIGVPLIASPDSPVHVSKWSQIFGSNQDPSGNHEPRHKDPSNAPSTTGEVTGLFELSQLTQALEVLQEETGTDRIRELQIEDDVLLAKVRVGDSDLELLTIRDHQVVKREPLAHPTPADAEWVYRRSFRLAEIDWADALARIPSVADMAAERGLEDGRLDRITVLLDQNNFHPLPELTFHLRNDDAAFEKIRVDARGNIKPEEFNATLPDEEKARYYYDAEHAAVGVMQAGSAMRAHRYTQVKNMGTHLQVSTSFTNPEIDNGSVTATVRQGGVSTVRAESEPRGKELFVEDDVIDWEVILDAVEPAADLLGADTESLEEITIERSDGSNAEDAPALQATIYFHNVGTVTIDMTGKILSHSG